MINNDLDNVTPSFSAYSLPEFDPAPALWERIRAGNGRRVRRRRIRQIGGLGLGTTMLVLVGLHFDRQPNERSVGVNDVAEVSSYSQQLQDAVSNSGASRLYPAAQSRLLLIDSELQAAYDHGAGDAELKKLWAQRNRLLETLVEQNTDRGHRFTRI